MSESSAMINASELVKNMGGFTSFMDKCLQLSANDMSETSSSVLGTLMIPEGISVITKEAFMGLQTLRTLIVPAYVRFIEGRAFANCSMLTDVVLLGDTTVSDSAFEGCDQLRDIKRYMLLPSVPDKNHEADQKAEDKPIPDADVPVPEASVDPQKQSDTINRGGFDVITNICLYIRLPSGNKINYKHKKKKYIYHLEKPETVKIAPLYKYNDNYFSNEYIILEGQKHKLPAVVDLYKATEIEWIRDFTSNTPENTGNDYKFNQPPAPQQQAQTAQAPTKPVMQSDLKAEDKPIPDADVPVPEASVDPKKQSDTINRGGFDVIANTCLCIRLLSGNKVNYKHKKWKYIYHLEKPETVKIAPLYKYNDNYFNFNDEYIILEGQKHKLPAVVDLYKATEIKWIREYTSNTPENTGNDHTLNQPQTSQAPTKPVMRSGLKNNGNSFRLHLNSDKIFVHRYGHELKNGASLFLNDRLIVSYQLISGQRGTLTYNGKKINYGDTVIVNGIDDIYITLKYEKVTPDHSFPVHGTSSGDNSCDYDLNEESFLKKLGYSTKVETSKRQEILNIAVRRNGKREVLRYLEFFIRTKENQHNGSEIYAYAISIWQSDISYVKSMRL